MASKLSVADVDRLIADGSKTARADTAAKVAEEFHGQALNEAERQIAEDIFRALVHDAELIVRETLSKSLQACPDVPRDVALTLARDVEEVSLPILRSSEVLTDEDLIEIVKDQNHAKQVAIAQRPSVSAKVADAVIDAGNETAVARLVSNEGAQLDEGAFDRVMSDFQESDAVSDSLSRRSNMPAAVQEQLVTMLTEKMTAALSGHVDLPADQLSNVLLQARERATLSLLGEGSSDHELEQLVEQMHVNGRLTASVVLRAIAMGDVSFFEVALARLARIPVPNARILIHDEGRLGLKSLYDKASLPSRLYPAFRAGVDVARDNDYDGGPNDRERYAARMVERLLTRFEDPSDGIAESDIDYLIGKLNQIAA